jgi:hypothetical protein
MKPSCRSPLSSLSDLSSITLALLAAACTSPDGTDRDAAAALDAGSLSDGSVAIPDAATDASVSPGMDASTTHDADVPDACTTGCAPTGRWTTGDLHVHTIQSNDAQVTLAGVLEAAFTVNQLD